MRAVYRFPEGLTPKGCKGMETNDSSRENESMMPLAPRAGWTSAADGQLEPAGRTENCITACGSGPMVIPHSQGIKVRLRLREKRLPPL